MLIIVFINTINGEDDFADIIMILYVHVSVSCCKSKSWLDCSTIQHTFLKQIQTTLYSYNATNIQ